MQHSADRCCHAKLPDRSRHSGKKPGKNRHAQGGPTSCARLDGVELETRRHACTHGTCVCSCAVSHSEQAGPSAAVTSPGKAGSASTLTEGSASTLSEVYVSAKDATTSEVPAACTANCAEGIPESQFLGWRPVWLAAKT